MLKEVQRMKSQKLGLMVISAVLFICLVPFCLGWTVSGTIYNSVGGVAVPAANAEVNLSDAAGVLINTSITGSDGKYSFTTSTGPPPPRIISARIPSHTEVSVVSKPTSPLGSDQVIDATFAFACPDADGDSHYILWCGGDDCDDSNAAINTGSADVCNGIDDDCNAATADGSGEAAPLNTLQSGVCALSTRACTAGAWADLYTGIASYEAAEATCDSKDNDCDAAIDESLLVTLYPDTDADLYGNSSSAGVSACSGTAGYVSDNTDCNDADAGISPGAADNTNNGVDNDCDGSIDESYSAPAPSDDDEDDSHHHSSGGGSVYAPENTHQTVQTVESNPAAPTTPASTTGTDVAGGNVNTQTGAEGITGAVIGTVTGNANIFKSLGVIFWILASLLLAFMLVNTFKK
jgi:hypothetical protein